MNIEKGRREKKRSEWNEKQWPEFAAEEESVESSTSAPYSAQRSKRERKREIFLNWEISYKFEQNWENWEKSKKREETERKKEGLIGKKGSLCFLKYFRTGSSCIWVHFILRSHSNLLGQSPVLVVHEDSRFYTMLDYYITPSSFSK